MKSHTLQFQNYCNLFINCTVPLNDEANEFKKYVSNQAKLISTFGMFLWKVPNGEKVRIILNENQPLNQNQLHQVTKLKKLQHQYRLNRRIQC